MDQLVIALTELTVFQKEQQSRTEKTLRQQEECCLEEELKHSSKQRDNGWLQRLRPMTL